MGIYAVVVLVSATAWFTALRRKQQPWHARCWLLLAVFFVLLLLSRYFQLEEILRDALRASLRSSNEYGHRRDFQRPLVAAIVGIGALVACWWFYKLARTVRGRRNFAVMAGLVGAFGMAFLISLRMVSLHAIDALLYGLRLNWVADIGLSLMVAAAAAFYVRLVTR